MNILNNVNKIALSVISSSYKVERVSDKTISDNGEVTVKDVETFSVIGNFQPYNPSKNSNGVSQSDIGDITTDLKVFYVITNVNLRRYDVVSYNGENWIILAPIDYGVHGNLSYVCRLGGSDAEQNYNWV